MPMIQGKYVSSFKLAKWLFQQLLLLIFVTGPSAILLCAAVGWL